MYEYAPSPRGEGWGEVRENGQTREKLFMRGEENAL